MFSKKEEDYPVFYGQEEKPLLFKPQTKSRIKWCCCCSISILLCLLVLVGIAVGVFALLVVFKVIHNYCSLEWTIVSNDGTNQTLQVFYAFESAANTNGFCKFYISF